MSKRRFSQQDKDFLLKKKIRIIDELPILNDLSLSDIEESIDKKQLLKMKKDTLNSKFLMRQKSLRILNHRSEEEKSQKKILIMKKRV